MKRHLFVDDGRGDCVECGEGLEAHRGFVVESADGKQAVAFVRRKRLAHPLPIRKTRRA
jgi:hypothetical protein